MDKEIIASFYVDYSASEACNYSELAALIDEVGPSDIPFSIYFEVSEIISNFDYREYDAEAFRKYFLSRHLIVPPSYDEQLHMHQRDYPIVKIIRWIRYPCDFSFNEIHKFFLKALRSEFFSNPSIVGVNPRDYLNEKGKRPNIWKYPSLVGKSFYITGEIELVDPASNKPYTPEAFETLICKKGGKVVKQINPDLDYIIVGGSHSPSYTGKYKGQRWFRTESPRSIPIISDITLFNFITNEYTCTL
ncbi:MAG: hypothetical protein EAX86_06135 [Candidatus Heimdallarchaeota archaeon]|nr:hypothetical protein [Candidatus Heimdallarchaeota archaeon]